MFTKSVDTHCAHAALRVGSHRRVFSEDQDEVVAVRLSPWKKECMEIIDKTDEETLVRYSAVHFKSLAVWKLGASHPRTHAPHCFAALSNRPDPRT